MDPFPVDGRAHWLHMCRQGQVTLGGRWPNSYQAKQDRLPPHACKLSGRRFGRGGGETFVTRDESGASESVWPKVWRLCKRTSGLNAVKQAISTKLTLCWKRRKHAHGLQSGGWWTRSFARSAQQALEVQSLQRVPYQQTDQFLEQNTLRPSAMCGRRHFPFQKQQKTAHQGFHRQFGLRQVWFFLLFSSRLTSTSTRRYEVSGLDPGTPVSLDVRFAEDPSLPSGLPYMPRQLPKCGGSFSANLLCILSRTM